jgi:pimeloyl-ACP methyl ester carboxylesterase
MMAATVSLAPACVTVRGAAPARGARSALRGGAPLSRRPSWVRASPDDAASAGSDEPKREKKSDGSTAAGEGLENADDWIANWKAGNFPRAKGWKFGDPSSEGPGTFSEEVNAGSGDAADDETGEEENAIDPNNQYGGDPNAYAYVFCHNLMSPPEDSFACMYLKDVLGALDVPLLTPSLISDGDEELGDGALTVTAAARRLAAAVAALPDDRPVRLIGSSLGAYVAAVYASDPENAKRVDRMMLLAPTFKPSACLATVEKEMGVSLGDAFREDLENHPDFPFAPCRAYVVHGYDDEASPLENSLTWVRDASVNLREGTGEAGEVAERRLLEVAGMGHGVENALPQIKSRLVDFFKLPFTVQGP